MADLTWFVGWMIAIFVGLLGGTVVVLIWIGKIKLDALLEEEKEGKASLGRLQFLIFTFVIALSLFLVIIGPKDGVPAFPASIPGEIFALLGISGGSFLVSKGITTNQNNQLREYELKKMQEQTRQMELGKMPDPSGPRTTK